MRDFSRNAMEFYFGIEPTEVVGNHVDADQDGVVNEISAGAGEHSRNGDCGPWTRRL